jgi:ABC-2 type transport system permease protein
MTDTMIRSARDTSFTGTRPLLWASLRLDFRATVPWIVGVTALTTSSLVVFPRAFPTLDDRNELAAALGSNPALGLIFGPARDIYTTEGFAVWRSLALGGLLTALMAISAVVRASRAQEDSGQAELLASGVLGRSSRLAVAVAVAFAGSLATGLVCSTTSVLAGGDPRTMVLLAATFVVSGCLFGALAALTAQVASEARTAHSLAVAVLGATFVTNGYLYSVEASEWTTWLTPQGWLMRSAPATDPSWWPLAVGVGATLVLLPLAFALQSKRDFGQGLIPPRQGPPRGRLRGPLALTWRLNRSSVAAWMIAFVVLGIVFGTFSTSVTDLLADNAAVQGVLAAGANTPEALVAAFLVTIMSLVGIFAGVVGVQVALRARSEEMSDRVEPLLAGSVSRRAYFGAVIGVAITASTMGVVIAGTLISAIASASDIGVDFGDAVIQALATVPAVWVVVSLAVVFVGARPRYAALAWLGVVLSFGLTILGPTLKLDDWALSISPFWHVPEVLAPSTEWAGLVGLAVVALGLVGVGLFGFRRRDLAVD